MRNAFESLIAGASSAIDIVGPPPPARLSPAQATALHWQTTGTYLWTAVHAHQPAYEQQNPLFDADAPPQLSGWNG